MMQEPQKNKLYWLGFFVSTLILGWMIYSHNEWLTLMLPFVTTFFVKAMKII